MKMSKKAMMHLGKQIKAEFPLACNELHSYLIHASIRGYKFKIVAPEPNFASYCQPFIYGGKDVILVSLSHDHISFEGSDDISYSLSFSHANYQEGKAIYAAIADGITKEQLLSFGFEGDF